MDSWRKKLLYRSCRRGIKELDILLGQFAQENLESMSDDDLQAWQKLCEINDQDLLRYFVEGGEINLTDSKIRDWILTVRSYWKKK